MSCVSFGAGPLLRSLVKVNYMQPVFPEKNSLKCKAEVDPSYFQII